MCCVQYDPVIQRRFAPDDTGEDGDQPVEFGRYKSEAAKALTKSYQDEEEEDDERTLSR